MNRTELIAFLREMFNRGMTIEETIEFLETAARKKKIGRLTLKEKMIIPKYETRGL